MKKAHTLLLAAVGAMALIAPAQARKSKDELRALLDLQAELNLGARNTSGDFEDNNRSNITTGARVSLDKDFGDNRLSLDAFSRVIEYLDKDERDRWSNGVSVGYQRKLGSDWSWGIGAGYASQLVGLEFDKFDQASLRSGLTYDSGNDRVRVGGGFRWRDYDDSLDSDGKGFFAEADYRHNFGGRRSAILSVDYDRINADVDSRDYRRIGVAAGYGFPIARKTDLDLSLRWRRWIYDNRIISGQKRVDHSIQPTVRLTHEFAEDWDLTLEAAWRRRWSRDPDGEESGPRGTIGVRKRFRLDD